MSIRAIAVDYHNTLPLRAGIAELVDENLLELDLAHPAEATRRFRHGQYALGLLPVAAQLGQPATSFVGEYGIISDGFVGSVGIFSELPLEEVETIFLDHDSRSSVLLARVLLKHHWRLSPKLVEASRGYRKQIGGTTAGVIIGDPAIAARGVHEHYYDLGAAWKAYTGLPFVYASWLAREELPTTFVGKFDQAQARGVAMRTEVAREHQAGLPHYDLQRYFNEQIQFRLSGAARAGRELFLALGAEMLGLAVPASAPRLYGL